MTDLDSKLQKLHHAEARTDGVTCDTCRLIRAAADLALLAAQEAAILEVDVFVGEVDRKLAGDTIMAIYNSVLALRTRGGST